MYIYNIYIYIYILMRLVFQKHQNIIIYITFTWCINQFPLVNTFFFLFPQTFLLINFIIAQLQLISFFISDQLHHYLSTRFPLFRDLNLLTAFIFFLCLWLIAVVFWMLWMLITVYKVKFTLWETLTMFTV